MWNGGLLASQDQVLPVRCAQVWSTFSRFHPHGPQRERAYPGQPAAPQPVPMNPARRAPRRPAFKRATPASVPSPGPTPDGPVDPGNAEAIAQIMTALESMGLPDMLQQVRSSIPPAPAVKTKVVSNEKRLANLGSKINILEQQSAKLTKHLRRLEEEFLETRECLNKQSTDFCGTLGSSLLLILFLLLRL